LYIDSEKKLKCKLEAKEREIEQYKEMFEQSYGLNKSRNVRIGELLAENGRLREVLKWIVEHSIDYQAIIKARQALKGGRECPSCFGTGNHEAKYGPCKGSKWECSECEGTGKDGDS
jgi:hypothetical protein